MNQSDNATEQLRRIAILPLLIAALLPMLGRAEIGTGIVIEEVRPHGAGERAGLQVGDALLSWELTRGGDDSLEGEFQTPLDLTEVLVEVAPRGSLRVRGIRDDKGFELDIGQDKWGVRARPQLDADTLARHRDAIGPIRADDPDIAKLRELALDLVQNDQGLDAVWMLVDGADALGETGHWALASDLHELALDAVDTANVTIETWVHHRHGEALMQQSRFDEAAAAFLSALELQKILSEDRLGVAANLAALGQVAVRRGKLDAALEYFQSALSLQEQQAPHSLAVANTLAGLGRVTVGLGDLPAGESHMQRAVNIADGIAPNAAETAVFVNGLAITKFFQEEVAEAETLFQRAYELKAKVEPDGIGVSVALANLGMVAQHRGDFASAGDYYSRALEIDQRLTPDSMEIAITLNNLGTIARDRGDLTGAEDYLQQALAMYEKFAPGSVEAIGTLNNLGNVAEDRGELDRAEQYYRQALGIQRSQGSGRGVAFSIPLAGLGLVAKARGNLNLAEDYFKQALEFDAEEIPDGRVVAVRLKQLGDVAFERNDFAPAQEYYKRALRIFARVSPGTYREARVLYRLGVIYRGMGEALQARQHLARAVAALESQQEKLGGSEQVKSGFRAQYQHIYEEYMDHLLELGDEEGAFHMLERSRARIFTAMLGERDLVFDLDIPAALASDRRRAAVEYERIQRSLSRMSESGDADGIEDLHKQLRDARTRQEELKQRVRELSPALAALKYPEPLTLSEARAAREPGSVVLSYSVGAERTRVFVLTTDAELKVVTVTTGEEALGTLVERYRYLMDRGRWDQIESQELIALGAELYDLLLRPLEAELSPAERLLIIPDGPLHLLPFAALVRSDSGADHRYLIEWKAVHRAGSLTVHDELGPRAAGPARQQRDLVAFGDPQYPSQTTPEPATTALVRSVADGDLRELPWSRKEVDEIAKLYPRSRVYTGLDATEERAKSIDAEVRFVHFATHAVLNDRFPLDSAIALSIHSDADPQRDNGLLQVWEIFETLRLDAKLVTVSACETALGSQVPGEGVIGLTRAFQYAGAESVLASLWGVSDQSTSELMARFYAELRDGLRKDDALRTAQIDMILRGRKAARRCGSGNGLWQSACSWLFNSNSSPASHPYHWAAFVLNGRGD